MIWVSHLVSGFHLGVGGWVGGVVVVVGGGVSHLPTLQNVTPDSPTLGIANNVTGEGNGKNYNDSSSYNTICAKNVENPKMHP